MEEIVKLLIEKNKKVSTMESCTGGYIVNSITNIPGASDIIEYSAITYSNEYKIKMGVDKELIDKYTVYSTEVSRDMAYKISNYSLSNYGVGITGRLGRIDKNNIEGDSNTVYISIYDRDNNKYLDSVIKVDSDDRVECKEEVLKEVIKQFNKVLFK